MKIVLLAGGLGTRLREETEFRPKPMVPVGGKPILWHIMKTFAHYGHQEFIVCAGYRGDYIRQYFHDFEAMNTDFTVHIGQEIKKSTHGVLEESGWVVTVAETGATTVDGTTLESLLNSRNWRVEQISGTFTSATLVITESSITDGTHEIGKSNNNQVGTYVSLGSQSVSAGAITSPAGQGVGFYAIGVKASCTNPTAGGTIAETQTICSGGDPAAFTSSVAASGNIGTLEYKWQYSSTSDFSSDINDIASSNAETYDAPSGLTATGYYRRLARVSCKADWNGSTESNILTVTVRSAFTTGDISSTGQSICFGGTPTEIGSTTAASGGDGSITYSWRSSSDSYSAAIDGANPRQIFRKITLPLLLQILSPLLIASFAFNFNNFNLIYLLTGGGPRSELDGEIAGATDILISYTYKIAFGTGTQDLGLASAISLIIFMLVASISLYSLRKSKVLETFA